MSDVTHLLSKLEAGDPQAAEKLLPLVYDELRKLAAVKLAQEKPGQTLQATALVHEAYVRLVGRESEAPAREGAAPAEPRRWNGRGHFFGAAAEAMRRILVESARRKQEIKHGGLLNRVALEDVAPVTNASPEQLVILDDALRQLGQHDLEASEVFKLRYFAGLSVEQAAECLGISRATAYRHWTFAKAWLQSQL